MFNYNVSPQILFRKFKQRDLVYNQEIITNLKIIQAEVGGFLCSWNGTKFMLSTNNVQDLLISCEVENMEIKDGIILIKRDNSIIALPVNTEQAYELMKRTRKTSLPMQEGSYYQLFLKNFKKRNVKFLGERTIWAFFKREKNDSHKFDNRTSSTYVFFQDVDTGEVFKCSTFFKDRGLNEFFCEAEFKTEKELPSIDLKEELKKNIRVDFNYFIAPVDRDSFLYQYNDLSDEEIQFIERNLV